MDPTPRFLRLSEVADTLSISESQTYALVRRGDLRAIRVGGRGQWRVERVALEDYVSRMYDSAAAYISEHPFADDEPPPPNPPHDSP